MTLTTPISDLMRPILVDPWDDGARLVYADAIEELEPERAEYIRALIDDHAGRGDEERVQRAIEGWDRSWEEIPGVNPFDINSPMITWRRGFPFAVACTLSAFMGGECVCVRYDAVARLAAVMGCLSCHGTGRLPGLADTICGRWPVTSVTLTGIKPQKYGSTESNWHWNNRRCTQLSSPESTLPDEIYNKLNGNIKHIYFKTYASRESAQRSLSDAAVNFARSRAGLPELKRN